MSCTRFLGRAAAVAALSMAAITGARAVADWSQWRGPNRDGHAGAVEPPAAWPDELHQVWRVEVGEGHSTPLLVGDDVYVFNRQGEEEVVQRLRLADGSSVWRQAYAAPYKVSSPAAGHGAGPKSTPTLADGRLFTFGIGGILTCWEADTGERLWRKDSSAEFPATSPLYGTACSPLVAEGLCIAHVGGHDRGALVAFDAASGEERWRATDDGPAYASPILVDLGGTRQIVTQTQSAHLGVDLESGRVLWRIDFTTAYDQNSVTPLVVGESLLLGGYDQPTAAYRVVHRSGRWTADEAWSNPNVPLYMSTPVAVDGAVFGFTHRNAGQLFCLDPSDGAVRWTDDGRFGDNAALVAAGDLVFALSATGELLVLAADAEEMNVLARYQTADSPTWAHPVVEGDKLLIKDATALTLWTW